MFPQRPKPVKEEDDEDLLRSQQEFLTLKEAGKIQPSVSKVIKAEDSKRKSKNEDNKPSSSTSDEPITLNVDSLAGIGDLPIIERDVSNFGSILFPKKVKLPFPKPQRRQEVNLPMSINQASQSTLGKESYSKENDDLLQNLSKEKILAMRDEIMSRMNPDQIEFLKNRRKRSQPSSKQNMEAEKITICQPNRAEEMETDDNVLDINSVEKSQDLPIPLNVVQEHNWLHMDVIEEEKLEWTRPPRGDGQDSGPKNARFNFSGNLILEEKSPKEGLHHHGEDPDKAGYSLAEIYTFIQSTFDAQVIMGLKILAKIMDKTHKGYYDLCFNTNLAKECLENTEIILSIRKCLDSSSESVIREAILCLHALICNNLIDEPCLDRLFPGTMHFHNLLYLQPLEEEKDMDHAELKDDQLVKLEVIKGLLRFETLPRLRYLMDNNIKHKEDPTVLNKIMEILIRIARHSPSSCKAIVDCPYLIETIVTNFVPAKIDFENHSIYNNPLPKALKLLRLLMSDTGSCIKIMNTHIQLWDAFQSYLTLDPDCFREKSTNLKRANVLQLAIESLRVWCVLLGNPEVTGARDCFNQVYPVIFRQLQYCLTLTAANNKFDFQYAATLVKCLVFAAAQEENFQKGYGSLVESLLFQSIREIVDINIVPPFDTLMMVTTSVEFMLKNNCKPSLLMMNLLNPLLDNERIMKILAARLKKCSFILQSRLHENGCRRDAENLPSFGSIHFGGDKIKFVDLAQDDSVMFFIESLLSAAEATKSSTMVSKIILNQYIFNYIASIAADHCSIQESIFKQLEFTFIYQLCMSSPKVMINREQIFYSLALVSLHNLKDVQMKENLLNFIIFNPNILAKLLSSESKTVEDADSIKQTYFKFSKFENHFWIFDPITISFKDKSTDLADLSAALQFIHFLLCVNRKLITRIIPPETFFTMVATIYLLDARLFAEESLKYHLKNLLAIFIDVNLSISSPNTTLPHISNFLNFFDVFMKQFESESFGDAIFINYLLVFLKPSSHNDFKKKILSDYPVALRFITLQLDDLLLPMESLLYPIVEDSSIIELFLGSLLCNQIMANKKSIFYLVAVHHVHHALFKQNCDSAGDSDRRKRCLLSIEKSNNVSLKDHLTKFMDSDLKEICVWTQRWTLPTASSQVSSSSETIIT